MNFEAIETAFELLLENVQTIENDLGTHAYDALIEQNSYYLGAEVSRAFCQRRLPGSFQFLLKMGLA